MSESGVSGFRDIVAVLGVLLLSAAVAVLALSTARGVVPLGDGDVSTESVSGWWWLAFLLAPLPAACVRRRITTAAALVLPQFVVAAVCVARYRASGWGDGLEVLGFLHPVLLTVVTGGLVAAVSRRPLRAFPASHDRESHGTGS